MKTFLIALLAAALLASTGPIASAKRLPACKKGLNAKKCRCPAGQKLVKKGHKYRCQKKKAPQQQQQQPGGDQGTTTGTTDPGTSPSPDTGGTTDPPAGNGAQTERDDAGYTAQLASSRFGPRTDDSSSGGIFTYTYDFCPNGQFSLHSEYYNSAFGGGTDTYNNGTWTLEQGFKVLQSTNGAKWAGILVMRETDGSTSRIEIDTNDSAGQFVVGNAAHLAGGLFSRSPSPVC